MGLYYPDVVKEYVSWIINYELFIMKKEDLHE